MRAQPSTHAAIQLPCLDGSRHDSSDEIQKVLLRLMDVRHGMQEPAQTCIVLTIPTICIRK